MELKEAIEELEELKETIKTAFWNERYIYIKVVSIKTVLKELDTFEEKVDKLTAELDKQKQVKAEMRKVAWEEGYNQGYLAGAMESI